jgi:hypothetical protein
MKIWRGVGLGVAATALAVSGVVFGATIFAAVRVEKVSGESGVSTGVTLGPDASEVVSGERKAFSAYPNLTYDELLDAVNQDFFQPDRRPTPERYLLPSERMAFVPDSRDNRRQREPDLRIVGVAIAGDVSLALVQLDDSLPIAVWLGEEVDGYRLTAISEERVTLAGLDEEFTYPVVEQLRGRESNRSSRSDDRGRDSQAEAARALNGRLQEAVLRMGRGQGRGGMVLPEAMQFRLQLPAGADRPGGQQVPTPGGRPGGSGGGLL